MRKKIDSKDARLLREQKYHMTGELNFLRSEEDLQDVISNSMQSIKVLIEYMSKCKKKYATTDKLKECNFHRLEAAVYKLLKQISMVHSALMPNQEEKKPFCIPAACICMECIAKILTIMVVSFIQLLGGYERGHVVSIMAQVFLY